MLYMAKSHKIKNLQPLLVFNFLLHMKIQKAKIICISLENWDKGMNRQFTKNCKRLVNI